MARYSYKAQPEICKWNLLKLAEAMSDVLPLVKSRALLEDMYVIILTCVNCKDLHLTRAWDESMLDIFHEVRMIPFIYWKMFCQMKLSFLSLPFLFVNLFWFYSCVDMTSNLWITIWLKWEKRCVVTVLFNLKWNCFHSIFGDNLFQCAGGVFLFFTWSGRSLDEILSSVSPQQISNSKIQIVGELDFCAILKSVKDFTTISLL